MTDNDKERFAFILQGLAEDKGIQLSTPGIAMKFEALKSFNIEDIQRAAISMMGNKKFATMPSVADFIEYLGGGSAEDIGQEQAAIVWGAIKKYGYTRTVCFDNPITQAVILLSFGGWQKMCSELTEDQQKWFIKDFVKAYGAFARRGVKEYGALPGAGEFDSRGIALIGDPVKAQKVLEYKPREQAAIPLIQDLIKGV